jgi:hypothetical protein
VEHRSIRLEGRTGGLGRGGFRPASLSFSLGSGGLEWRDADMDVAKKLTQETGRRRSRRRFALGDQLSSSSKQIL